MKVPFVDTNMMMSNVSSQANATDPIRTELPFTNRVSQQSAMWPVIACMFALMMQKVGKTCSIPPWTSPYIRPWPIICVADSIISIVKLICLICVGCSFRTAARHVWYDRFRRETDYYDLSTSLSDWVNTLLDFEQSLGQSEPNQKKSVCHYRPSLLPTTATQN